MLKKAFIRENYQNTGLIQISDNANVIKKTLTLAPENNKIKDKTTDSNFKLRYLELLAYKLHNFYYSNCTEIKTKEKFQKKITNLTNKKASKKQEKQVSEL